MPPPPPPPVPSADNGKEANPYSFGRAVDRSLKTAQRVAEAIDLTTRDAVERGVETAYSVVDEYVRRGRAAAERRHTHASGANDMNQERKGPGYGPWAGMPWMSGAAASNPFLGPWMQMMQMWSDSMMAFMPSGMPANPMTAWMSAAMPQTAIAVRIASRNPAKVSVTLDAGAQLLVLRADALVLDGNGYAPDIAPPTIESGTEVTVRVSIGDDQPGGRYRGAIRDAAGGVRGQLTVDLEGPTSFSSE
jgi:hypothetical protein